MAYSPLGEARILISSALAQVAERRGTTPAPVALAWVLRQDGMIAIP